MLAVYHVVIILCLLYMFLVFDFFFFFFKQKTAYEMRISDWSSDVCSSDLRVRRLLFRSLRSQSALTHQLSRQPSRLQGRPIGDTRFVAFRLSHRWHRSGRPKGDAERRICVGKCKRRMTKQCGVKEDKYTNLFIDQKNGV